MRSGTASVLLKDRPEYGREHFVSGLQSIGFGVSLEPKEQPDEKDILVLWNRLPTHDQIARRYEQAGATVLIAETGWIGNRTFALSRHYHNGAGTWHIGTGSRWYNFGIELKPWRKSGDHVLVLPQRGMGMPGIGMPRDWLEKTLPKIMSATSRPIVVRHASKRNEPLESEFVDCHAVVTWGSGAAIKAVVAGIPAFYEQPNWIGAPCATRGFDDLENVVTNDFQREDMLRRLSWAMWKEEEISAGDAFRCVLL